MSKVVIKQSHLGGARTPSKLKYATQRLLKVLWERFGGVRELERKTGYAAQKFIHWRNRGKVSYKCIGKLSRDLEVPIQSLDYEGVGELLSGNPNSWKEVVDSLKFSSNIKDYINKGVKPKTFKAK